ncbi:unnamed protein product [Paramecium primaurelia]|uniref:Uncharacterized protein n=1 Tax=Paramecium primaurelia TaxID=5886 RepID=A0A8S1K8P9_PARPR|nr:unnamed protein product [Paramecium primaurelia]
MQNNSQNQQRFRKIIESENAFDKLQLNLYCNIIFQYSVKIQNLIQQLTLQLKFNNNTILYHREKIKQECQSKNKLKIYLIIVYYKNMKNIINFQQHKKKKIQ